MTTGTVLLLVALGAVWLGLIAVGRWIAAVEPRQGDFVASAALRLIQVYARLVHRLEIGGREHIPPRPDPVAGDPPLIVVANHTAGIDPLLIQAAIGWFEPRWMMASDMRAPALEWFWRWADIIFVDRQDPQPEAFKTALRHLRSGGVLGIFPEGRIERPPRTLYPFQSGVGALAKKSGARVLPVVVRGTPTARTAWGSLLQRSHASVEFLPIRDYSGELRSPREITAELREAFRQATSWPVEDDPPPLLDAASPAEAG